MHGAEFFQQAFIYLSAAVLAVPLAKRFGLGSVLGYLIAGILIGPNVLGLVGSEGQDVMHFAEFGVVMMLFLVGLELEPNLLWRLRGPVLGMGGAQVAGTSLLLFFIGWSVGLAWQESLSVGMILSLSSTAIVLQTLSEKGVLKTGGGQGSFSVLLFQDIAVIPMLAFMPLLATFEAQSAADDHETWLSGLPAWSQAAAVLAMMTGIVVAGRSLLTPVFRFIAKAHLRETFTAAALLLVIGIALLMTKVGLSPALGTFVAGVVLATSEYRHELEAEIEPFKGLLLGLFFIAVGASIDFQLVAANPGHISALVLGLMLSKFVVLSLLGKAFRLTLDQNMLFSFALAQGGEFAFVLFSFATQKGIIRPSVADPVVVSVALSMALTPLSMMVNERWIQPRFGTKESVPRQEDEVTEDNPVIIAGYGRFGQLVARLLKSAGFDATLLDFDSDQVDLVRKFGARVYFGDASRVDLLEAAGASRAKLIVLALDNPEKTLAMVHAVRKHFPNLQILARARSRTDAFDLLDAGVQHVYRELLDSSLAAGRDALRLLGVRTYRAYRMTRTFRRHDEAFMRETAAERHDTENWIRFVRNRTRDLEQVLSAEYDAEPADDGSWDLEQQRQKADRTRYDEGLDDALSQEDAFLQEDDGRGG